MAIFLARKKIEGFETGGEKPLLEFLELLNSAAAREQSWGCRMRWWRRSTREGSGRDLGIFDRKRS